MELCDELFRHDCTESDPTHCVCLKICDAEHNLDCCILFKNECQFNTYATFIANEFQHYDVERCSGIDVINFDMDSNGNL